MFARPAASRCSVWRLVYLACGLCLAAWATYLVVSARQQNRAFAAFGQLRRRVELGHVHVNVPLSQLYPESGMTFGAVGPRWLRETCDDFGFTRFTGRVVELDLALTPADDEDLRHLSALPALRVLDLTGSRVTDAALPRVASLRRLEVVYLQSTQVSGAGVERLREECPRLKVVF